LKVHVCVAIAAERASEATDQIKRAESLGADLMEIRLDYLRDLRELDKIVKATSLPLIATNRQYEQGGCRRQKENQRVQTLLDAAKLGFQYVDVELTTNALRSTIDKLRERGSGVMVSFHDFKGTPNLAEMEKIIRSEMEVGADICKLITTANEAVDNVPCLLLTWNISRITKVICFAMGERGTVSRILAPIFGAHFTYASVEEGRETALGQLSITNLKKLYRSLGVED
jgi:3-dehydroquinate dehydratase type I